MDDSHSEVVYLLGNKVVPIEDSFDRNEEYKTVIERYYTKRYCLDVNVPMDDFCILFHSNRICVITLAPSHPLLTSNKSITKCDFQVSTKIDRLDNKASGKLKRGAQVLQQVNSPLFYVECSDGSLYKLCPGITGKLIEINDALVKDPNLLISDPYGKGYIAVVLPSIPNHERYKNELLTPEQYNEKRFNNVDT